MATHDKNTITPTKDSDGSRLTLPPPALPPMPMSPANGNQSTQPSLINGGSHNSIQVNSNCVVNNINYASNPSNTSTAANGGSSANDTTASANQGDEDGDAANGGSSANDTTASANQGDEDGDAENGGSSANDTTASANEDDDDNDGHETINTTRDSSMRGAKDHCAPEKDELTGVCIFPHSMISSRPKKHDFEKAALDYFNLWKHMDPRQKQTDLNSNSVVKFSQKIQSVTKQVANLGSKAFIDEATKILNDSTLIYRSNKSGKLVLPEMKDLSQLRVFLSELKGLLPPNDPLLPIKLMMPLHRMSHEGSCFNRITLPALINEYGLYHSELKFQIHACHVLDIGRSINHPLVQIANSKASDRMKTVKTVEMEVFQMTFRSRRPKSNPLYIPLPYGSDYVVVPSHLELPDNPTIRDLIDLKKSQGRVMNMEVDKTKEEEAEKNVEDKEANAEGCEAGKNEEEKTLDQFNVDLSVADNVTPVKQTEKVVPSVANAASDTGTPVKETGKVVLPSVTNAASMLVGIRNTTPAKIQEVHNVKDTASSFDEHFHEAKMRHDEAADAKVTSQALTVAKRQASEERVQEQSEEEEWEVEEVYCLCEESEKVFVEWKESTRGQFKENRFTWEPVSNLDEQSRTDFTQKYIPLKGKVMISFCPI